MRKIGALFAAVACMAMSGPAFASSFTGPGGTITVTGATSMSAPGFPTLACTATFTGVINANGTATINSASFTGGLGACSFVHLATPFTIVANSTTSVTVQQLQVTSPIVCGPQDVNGSWTNGSPSHFDIPTATLSPGGCTITAHLTVSGVTII